MRLPHTAELKYHDCDPFFGLPLEDVFAEYDPDLRLNLHLGASRPDHEEYLVDQPGATEESDQNMRLSLHSGLSRPDHDGYLIGQSEATEENDQSSALRSSDEWLQPDPGLTVDVDIAQNCGFDYSNYPSFLLSNSQLLVEGTSVTTPGSSTGASNGSTNSTTVGSSLSSPSPFPSSTNLCSGLTPILTELPGATPSLIGAPRPLQPKRGTRCLACQKVVSCRARLRSHQCNTTRLVCGFEGCKRGPEGFRSQKELNRHQQTIHADKALAPRELQVCQVCQYKTRREDHFRRHQEMRHR